MTKSKSSMVTRDITHLATDTLPVTVIQSEFSLLPLGRYLLPVTTHNRYQRTDSSGKLLFTTTSRSLTIVRYRMSLVTILVLDLVMIHWIHWIHRKSFRENSIGFILCRHVAKDVGWFILRIIWNPKNAVAGPEFARGGCHTQWAGGEGRGYAYLIFSKIFAKNFINMKEFGPRHRTSIPSATSLIVLNFVFQIRSRKMRIFHVMVTR